MPKQNVIATNFTSGEVSPLVRGRVDAQKYANGLETCENFIVRPQGPLWRRSGTKFMGQSKFHDKKSRLVAFEYSDTQGYILQFGDGYIHFWKNDGQLFETTTTELEAFEVKQSVSPVAGLMLIEADDHSVSGINVPSWGSTADLVVTPANNGTISLSNNGSGLVRVTTSVPHTLRTGAKAFFYSTDLVGINGGQYTVTRIDGYTLDLQGSTWAALAGTGLTAMYSNGVLPGDRIYISGASNYPEISDKFVIVTNVDSWYQFTINVPYADHGAPSSEEGHVIPIEVITPYSELDLSELRFVQSADVLYIIHPDHPVYKLTRLDEDGDRLDWLFAKVEFKDGPYLPLNSLAPTWDETTPANGTTFSDVYFELSGYSHSAYAECRYVTCALTIGPIANRILVTTQNAHGLSVGDKIEIVHSPS